MPNRILKESLTRSESINELSWFAEVLFYRLIVVADDFGRFDGRAAVIKGTCFPLRNIRVSQIEKGLNELASVSMIFTYTVEARSFLQIANWSKFQTTRAMKSKWPSPEEDNESQLELQTSQLELQNTKAAKSDQSLQSANTCKQLHADASRCSRETRNDKRESFVVVKTQSACAREELFECLAKYKQRAVEVYGSTYAPKVEDAYAKLQSVVMSLPENCDVNRMTLENACAYAEEFFVEGNTENIRNPLGYLHKVLANGSTKDDL